MKLIALQMLAAGMLAASTLHAREGDGEDYVDIPSDLAAGRALLEVAERAHDHVGEYYEVAHGHPRDAAHEHGEEVAGIHEGEDEELSAYEAVGEIWLHARALEGPVDPEARDIVKVVIAVIDAWTQPEDTYGAVKRGVELMPDRAAEIAERVAIKKDCNLAAGGLWPQQRVEERIRVEQRHAFISVPRACSCSQAAMFAAVSGLPEHAAFEAAASDAERARIVAVMVEKSNEILERVNAAQNRNAWDCACTDVNLAATMRGIEDDALRDGTWDGLAVKYVDEAGDTGLVVDAFGVVGQHPSHAWGSEALNSHQHTLRRKPEVYRGDPLLLDPFDPDEEWLGHTENDHAGFGQHRHVSDSIPTDVFVSEYLHGWNREQLERPEHERDERQGRNRALEIYNGTDRDIDLGQGQYILEIYSPDEPGRLVDAPPPQLVRNTITLDSSVTFELDKWEVRPEAAETLRRVVELMNRADIFSEILIVGHTCDLASDEYNQLLSERRALAVRDLLVGAGLTGPLIRTEGRGESQPLVANSSEANRARNRRIEITFVTRDGLEVERTLSGEASGQYRFSWISPAGAGLSGDQAVQVETRALPLSFGVEHYVEGDMSPRQVIGLNGRIEPGQTLVVAFDNSDEELTDKAHIVTGQLDFHPADTLVLRRFGGDMALSCRAHAYAYLYNFDPFIVPLPEPIDAADDPVCISPSDCESIDLASPN
ncbi:MAG: OmpA family protein [Xanthomonadales bacterium]|uniref:OmpA family protein n=1 Tax=Hydrogenophaga sp. TaxID=1904254 RepID=UPI0016AA7DF6|nr:OmpA family protein [Hydrogenophaga sp.]NIM71383.1 OmpA family protein [Xanthomonadales bacterium]NIN32302.1 OmpA family protein [Hydrogenophaga sp.]NIN60542.1 OmpA family protein [Xanthomonadales bacterium]NIN75894.1 OmpA family protein [Xanthomonadales bacterium]NIO13032.1 OmpA family protein [Xanthomonadales bacterium]